MLPGSLVLRTAVARTVQLVRAGEAKVTEEAGGPARRRVVLALALVLALDAADQGALGALAFQLEAGMHIGNAKVGLIATASGLAAAVATIPMGFLVDRVRRISVLRVTMLIWSAAEVLSGLAPSYAFLLGARLILGIAVASAGPSVASLTGDLIPARDRGRIWGLVLTGEVVGTGVGILYAGMFADVVGWRAGFFALALPSLAVALLIGRILPEPARGGQSRLELGATEIPSVEQVDARPDRYPETTEPVDPDYPPLEEVLGDRKVEPDEDLVLHEDPAELNLWESIRYVLRVRTNVVLIVASSLGYFFLAGIQTLAIIYVRGRFGLSQTEAIGIVLLIGLATAGGLISAGNIGDRLVKKGKIETRLVIGCLGLVGAAIVMVPALLTGLLPLALPLFAVAGFLLAAPNPGLDAARLDVMAAGMWGRSEGVRTSFRQALQSLAPFTFGVVSQVFGAPSSGIGAGVSTSHAAASAAQAHALEFTFLVLLVPVLVGGLCLLLALRSYPVDLVSARASGPARARRSRRRRGGRTSG